MAPPTSTRDGFFSATQVSVGERRGGSWGKGFGPVLHIYKVFFAELRASKRDYGGFKVRDKAVRETLSSQ